MSKEINENCPFCGRDSEFIKTISESEVIQCLKNELLKMLDDNKFLLEEVERYKKLLSEGKGRVAH